MGRSWMLGLAGSVSLLSSIISLRDRNHDGRNEAWYYIAP